MNPRLLIVGGGIAGIAAAIGARQAGFADDEILLVERLPYLGGVLPQCLHAGFGVRHFKGELNGPEYLRNLEDRLRETQIPVLIGSTVLEIATDHRVTLAGKGGVRVLRPDALILATGCRERPIGSLPIAGTRPAGILTAGTAQRMVNVDGWEVGSRFVVLGSGDVGMIMAGRFAGMGKEVLAVIEQRGRCGGLARNKKRYLDAFGIPLLTNSTVTEVFGSPRISGVRVQSDGEASRVLACDTLITSVGLVPELDLLHAAGMLPAPKWVFLAGNARAIRSFVDDVVDDGSRAATSAVDYLATPPALQ
jgi:NADPH-dependent 2,4-dienoyl-CoA reductase/sulfur reductase-like enzyme